ncbi:hypothetical protein MSAN_01159800 [Mycena sanguinolenta]|uniref:DUF2306 domain-containing protein n=1 Tax=Mycena sanguinolenta TaxID=230812 RepID=A0A8H6YLL5_9AGAR|nr:hypothetical protein MSAN_01159800 [Mycena sanguinolenta]
MSSTASTRIPSTLYPLSPSTLDEEPVQEKALGGEKSFRLERRSERHHSGPLNIYRSISWILGFRDKYSLLNGFVWGGALVGFCLARSVTMNPTPAKISAQLVPGEWFWFQEPMYKYNLFIHIYLTTLGGLGAPLQFFPAMRRRAVVLHRLNGYGVLFCLIVGNICGSIIARRTIGGELNVQSGYYLLGIMVVVSGILGFYYVKKDTRQHRKWMLRMVSYFAAVITARVCMLAACEIITDIGTYFSIWRCDEIINLLPDPNAVQSSFPQCVGVNTASVWAAVHASTRDGPLHKASAVRATMGMALWIATFLHIVGVEYYIHKTEAANQVRLGFALEPLDFVEDSMTSY